MVNAKKLKNTSKEHILKKCPAAVTCSSTVRKKNENNIQGRIKTNNSGKKLLMQRKGLRGVPKLNRRYFSEEYTSFDSVKAKQFQHSGTYEKKNSLKKLKATDSNQVMTMKKAEISKSSINKTNDSVKKFKSEEIVTRSSKGRNFQDSQTPEKKNSLKRLPKVTVSIQVIPVKKAKLSKSGISKTNDSVKKLENEEMVPKRKVTQNSKVGKSKNIKNKNDLKKQPVAVPAVKIKKNSEILVASTRNKNNTLPKSKNNLIMKGNSTRIRKINQKYCSEEYSSLLSVKVDKSKNIKNKNDLKKQPVAVPAVKIKKNREILVASTRNKNNTLPKSKNNLIMKENSTRFRKINQKYCSEEYSSLLSVKVDKSRKRKIENDLEKQPTAVPTAKIRKGLKISMTDTTNRNNETPKLKKNLIVKENPTRIRKINQKYYSGEYSSLFSANLNNSKVSILQSEGNSKKKAGVDSTDSSHKATSKKTLAITNMKKTNDSKNLKKFTINTDVVKRAPNLNRKYFSEEFSSHSLSQKKKSEDSDIYEDKHSSKNSNTGSLVSKKNSNILVAGEKKPKLTLQKSPSKLLIKKRELGRTLKTNRKYASEEYVSNLSAQVTLAMNNYNWRAARTLLEGTVAKDSVEYTQLQQIHVGPNFIEEACSRGFTELVNIFLNSGFPVNCILNKLFGKRMLHLLALYGHLSLVKLLLNVGADIDCKTYRGETPLFYAVQRDHLEVAKYLIDVGADINTCNTDGKTLLNAAFGNSEGMYKLLLESGCDPNYKCYLYDVCYNVKIVKMFLDAGACVNGIDTAIPLFQAARCGKIPVMQLLLEHGADINITDKCGNTALHAAVKGNELQSVKFLIEHGSLINTVNNDHEAPIFLSILCGKFDIAVLLINSGAVIDLDIHHMLLHRAIYKGAPIHVIECLLEHGADVTTVYIAETALQNVMYYNDYSNDMKLQIAKLLLIYGSNHFVEDYLGNTVLHWASRMGDVELVEYLIDYGLNVDAKNREGKKPIDIAHETGHPAIVNIIIEYHCNKYSI